MAVALTTKLRTSLLMILISLQLLPATESNHVCSDPKTVKNTKMNKYSGNYKEKSHLRYICEDGYKRQAGTSNLAICLHDAKTNKTSWKYSNISCIRDPLFPITTPSSTISSLTTSGLQFTQTLLPKETVKTVTKKTTASTSTEATVMENTDVTATGKQSSATHFIIPVQTTNLIDKQNSTWQKTETIAAVSSIIVIIPLVGIIILILHCRRRRPEALQTVPDQRELQSIKREDRAPASDTSNKDSEEQTFL
ncbi:interleukin-15 receptor subunit alpha isoform 3-T3 [Anomaloglossus baeobatrachus]|uniref:interleukin-15 receptor subunit alpha isoform X3 n=1 Tax=Anomaloglossus baeobatrachus TaxID=238106 RepID=UPI003F4F4199